MKWKSSREALPDDKEEVLIRTAGIYHLATFDKEKKAFILRSGEQVKVGQFVVQWTRLVVP
jgi:hypothetical protein